MVNKSIPVVLLKDIVIQIVKMTPKQYYIFKIERNLNPR